MTRTELLNEMKRLGACDGPNSATEYVINHPSDDALTIGLECDRADWLVWFMGRVGVDLLPFTFSCADRAVRQYAPAALDRAGLLEQAAALRALAPIVDRDSAEKGRYAARATDAAHAARAAYYAYAAYAAYAAAYYAAYAADAAYAAYYAYAAADAAYAAAARAADAAAYAAVSADAARAAAERKTHLADLHVLWAQMCARKETP